WVSTLMLEDLILRLHEVAECAVVGIPDPRWDERPLALVVLRGGASLDPAMIRAHLAGFVAEGLIPKYALPERIEQVEAIPKTSVGKLDKKAI
ncbi:fatty acid--CoA ligase, partial [Klebsiella pneumoniae]|uniref:AMP-binding enzyme n=2 Tax=Gammaproteobacteria TaxID=1236 RepID=UPI003908B1E1|nr:fatty acid--CoA ligase [Klebsiella pneumoniae]